MFARALLVSALFSAPSFAAFLKSSSLPEYNDPCPFGYGTGCSSGGRIDSGTRDQVANILEGILTKLSSHKDLVQVKNKMTKVAVSEVAGEKQTKMTKASVVAFKGLLEKLKGTKQGEVGGAALAHMLAEYAPADATWNPSCTYFGACGSKSDQPLDSATKDQVARILEGILGNLQSHKDF